MAIGFVRVCDHDFCAWGVGCLCVDMCVGVCIAGSAVFNGGKSGSPLEMSDNKSPRRVDCIIVSLLGIRIHCDGIGSTSCFK